MKKARNVIGAEAETMTRGKLEVQQEMDEAENVFGAKIIHIGGGPSGSTRGQNN